MRWYSLILINFFLTVHAVENIAFQFRCYNIENGLSSNYVSTLLQDNKGFIWIGTDRGLDRYDGTRFISFQKKDISCHGLGNSEMSALYQSSDKYLWVGTSRGLYIYEYATGQFHAFQEKTSNDISINSWISSIVQDKNGLFWIATRGQGVFSFDPVTKELIQYEMLHSNGYISTVLSDKLNNIWLTGVSGTYLLNKVNNQFEEFRPDGETVYSLTLFEDSMGDLWIGTWDSGLMKVENSMRCTSYLVPHTKGGINHIHSIIEYAPGTLLIGSDDGLTLFNTVTGTYKQFDDKGHGRMALSDKFVYPIIKDHEGGIWVGTFYGGVNYIPPYSGQFEGYNCSYPSDNFLPGKVASCFLEDKNSNVWIAFEDGGIACFSPETHKLVDVPGKERTKDWNVQSICLDNDEMWIATYARGFDVWNMRTGQIVSKNKGLIEKDAFALLKTRAGEIWAGTMKNIYLYDRKADSLALMKPTNELVRDIKEDTKGRIWAATNGNGIFRCEPERNIWKHYGLKEGLTSESVTNICVDRTGRIWIATSEGLCLYEPEKDWFRHIPLGIRNQDICCIIEDENVLWLTTGKGLVKYNPEAGTKQMFTRTDGLQTEAFALSSGLKTQKGEIFVGTTNGFNAFYPHLLHHNDNKPTVVLTGLELFNKEISVAQEDGILTSPIDYMKEINLSSDDNMISFLYTALSYCTPSKNQYAYQLVGFDKNWNYVGTQSKATYTNLPPGTYTFRVKASNNDGVWNEEGTSIRVIVHPPFYWSVPFKLCYVLLICGLGILLARRFIQRNQRKHEKEIEQVKVEKDKEMQEAKINFFTMIAHEIRTPVSLIIAPLENVMKEAGTLPAAIHDNLNVVNRNSQRLLYLVNQLLDFRKVQENEMKMRFTPQNVKELLSAICERFRPSMEQSGITFKVELPDDNFTADLDKEAITKLVSNLLSNATKYARDEVVLSCFVQNEQCFVIQVTDNGIGINEQEQKKIFNPFFQATDNKPGTGIGLSIVKGIADAHDGRVEVSSEVEKGTSFIVTLPIKQAVAVAVEKESSEELQVVGKILAAPSVSVDRPVMLLVDDNEEMLQFLVSNFAATYAIVTAVDGLKALEILQKQEVSLIISDWMMPHLNGIELCKQVRQNQLTSHIPFILLTAKTDLNSKIEGMDCGADVYIEKPFSPQYLEVCIKNLIEQRQLLKKKFSQMPMVPLNSIAGNATDAKFLTQMNEIIEQNFSNPELSVDFLAEKLCISRSGLFAKVKTLASITPNELIKVVRLKKAASLLAEKHYRVNEVCYMVGFDNPSYFSECFQKQFGMKPSKFINGEKGKF